MQYFTHQEIKERIATALSRYDSTATIGDLFFGVFDDSSIDDKHQSAIALGSDWQNEWPDVMTKYSVSLTGVFGAFQLVQKYDQATIGESDLDISDLLNPERLAKQVEYILAAAYMDELLITHHLDYETRLTKTVKQLLTR